MDGRSPACLLVLCGLPAVGKTSLAQAVLDHLVQSGAPIKAFHVCFDHYINKELMGNSELERAELSGAPGPGQVVMGTLEPKRGELRESPEVEQLTLQGASFKIERGDSRVFPVKPLQGDWRETPELERGDTGETLKREWAEPTGSPELEWAGFSPELWKRARRLAIQKVEELLREANEKEGPLAQRTLVIADDNFHLRSMRRELYVLARTLRAAIVFLYATTVLETSLSRNALRPPGKQVPKESILRMAATFEPPGQSAFLVGGCTGTSSRVCQSEGAEVHTEGGPDVLKGGPQSLEPAETKDGLELKRATSNPALDVSSHEASKTWKPGASREAELFGGGKEQGPSRPLTNRAADYSSDSSKGAEARRGMAGIARDGESALPERGQKGRTWEAPVVIIDTSVERGRTERAAEVWHRVWDAWGQAPEEPPDRAEEEAKRAAAVAATADSILHALDLRTRRALSSAMLDADKTGRHVIVDKKTLAQPLNRARKQLMTAVRLIHNEQILEAGSKKDIPNPMRSIRVLQEELFKYECGDGLEMCDNMDHGGSFQTIEVLAAKAGDWFESLCGRQRRIQGSCSGRLRGSPGFSYLPLPSRKLVRVPNFGYRIHGAQIVSAYPSV